jgi:hypothetical protein
MWCSGWRIGLPAAVLLVGAARHYWVQRGHCLVRSEPLGAGWHQASIDNDELHTMQLHFSLVLSTEHNSIHIHYCAVLVA